MSNEGKTLITLRAPEPSDVDLLYLWENDSSVWHTSLSTGPLSRHQIAQYVDSYEGDIYAHGSLRFIIENEGNAVGTIDVFDFDPRARHAFIGIYIVPERRRQGFGSSAVGLVASMMADYVGMTSLMALVAIDNGPSRFMFEAAGFVTTGRLARWIRRGATLVDAVVYQRCIIPSDGR